MIQNKKARYLYHLSDQWEAGICLLGAEVKAIRAGQASLGEAYAVLEGDEIYLHGFHISCADIAFMVADPLRPRKLLLHRQEIEKIKKQISQRGYTLVPLSIYPNERGLFKLTLALAMGKKSWDHRQDLKEKADRRDQR